MSDEVELPDRGELSVLPKKSIVVYALRCVLRVRPLLALLEKPTAEYKRSVVVVNGAYKTLLAAPSEFDVVAASQSTYHATNAEFAATADVAAVMAALKAVAIAADNAYSSHKSVYDSDSTFHPAANAYIAAGAAFRAANVAKIDTDTVQLVGVSRADYVKLSELKAEVTDASETGPLGDLWHGSPPDWYIESKEHYDKTIAEWELKLEEEAEEKRIISETSEGYFSTSAELTAEPQVVENEVPLEFYIDRGEAPKEVVQEVFDAISNLNIAAGGFGYLFETDGKSISIVPEGVSNDF